MTGRTLTPCWSASALMDATALLRAFASSGLHSVTPPAFAAASVAVGPRANHRPLFLSESRKQVQDEGSTSAPSSATTNGTPVSHKSADEVCVAAQPVQLGDADRTALTARLAKRSSKLQAQLKSISGRAPRSQ